MTRLRAVLVFMLVVAVALCANAFAGKIGTHSESFAMHETTTNQTAIFGAFLACVPNPAGGFPLIETAVSVSNITANPGGATHYYSPDRDIGPVDGLSGDVTAYLYDVSGAVIVAPLGALDSGQTTSFLLCDALEGTAFTGYAWLVADFGAISGTLTNLWDILGVGGTYLMEPAVGGVPVVAEMEP